MISWSNLSLLAVGSPPYLMRVGFVHAHSSFTDLRSQCCNSGSVLGEFTPFGGIAYSGDITAKVYRMWYVTPDPVH